jgi:tRNA U38,U39,U40 pseudouridine synthase TruA
MDINAGVTNYRRKVISVDASPVATHSSTEAVDPRFQMCVLTVVGNAFLWHMIRCVHERLRVWCVHDAMRARTGAGMMHARTGAGVMRGWSARAGTSKVNPSAAVLLVSLHKSM